MTAAPDPVALCLSGTISPEVALARLVLDGIPPDRIGAMLPPGSRLAALHHDMRGRLAELAAMLATTGIDHAGAASPRSIAALFDRAVTAAPEASVAAWSLNDPAVLARGTAEIVDWARAQHLIGPDRDVLDLGCGIGRVAAALAPHSRSVIGLDVSARMIAEAARRHPAEPGLRFAVTTGSPPLNLPTASIDLLLAVDSFPYMLQSGLADAMLAEAVRLLRPGGAMAVLNLSYRNDEIADAADARRWAAQFGLTLGCCGARPFSLWDGAAYVWRVA